MFFAAMPFGANGARFAGIHQKLRANVWQGSTSYLSYGDNGARIAGMRR